VITMECIHRWHRSIESSGDLLHRRAGRSLEQLLVPSAPDDATNLLLLHGHPSDPNCPNILDCPTLWYGYNIIPCCLRSCHNNLETSRMLFAPLSASAGASGVHRESTTAQCIMMFFSHGESLCFHPFAFSLGIKRVFSSASDMHLKRQDDAPPECRTWWWQINVWLPVATLETKYRTC